MSNTPDNAINNRFANLEVEAPVENENEVLVAQIGKGITKRTGLKVTAEYKGVWHHDKRAIDTVLFTNQQVIEQVADESAGNSDIFLPRLETRLDLCSDGEIRLKGHDSIVPTKALFKLAEFVEVPKQTIKYLSGPGLSVNFKQQLVDIFNTELAERPRTNCDKQFLVRLDGAGKVRHFASEDYAIYDTLEMLQEVIRCIPDGLWTKFNFDGNNFNGTIVAPDHQIKGKNSNHSVGAAVKNSEISDYGSACLPFLFTFICTNGAILGRSFLEQVARKKHSKSQGFDTFLDSLTTALEGSLDLGHLAVERFEALENVEVEKPESVIAYLSKSFGVEKDDASQWLLAYGVESVTQGQSASAIINGLTRAAQRSDFQIELEEVAGRLLTADGHIETDGLRLSNLERSWDSILRGAERMSPKDIEKRIPILVAA